MCVNARLYTFVCFVFTSRLVESHFKAMSPPSVVDTVEAIALLRKLRASVRRIGIECFATLFDLAPTLRSADDNEIVEQKHLDQHLELLHKLVEIHESVG